MATITRRPSRSTSRIQAAPSYEGVASSFASSFQTALKQERVAKFDNMVTAYTEGSASWDDLKKFIEDYSKEVGVNTSEGADALKALVKYQEVEQGRIKDRKRTELESSAASADGYISQQDRYRIESEMLGLEEPGSSEYLKQQQNVINSFENAQVELVNERKTQLFEQYMDGGITPQEELAITRELKAIANPQSKAYQDLVLQESQILNTIKSGSGDKTNQTNEFSFFLADELAKQQAIESAFGLGQVDGMTRAELSFDSATAIYDELVALAQSGINVDEGALQNARQLMASSKSLIDLYNNGQVFDVVSKDGSVKTVTTDGKDVITGADVNFMNEPVSVDANGLWSVVDPETGEVKASGLGSKQAALSKSEELGYDTSFTTVIKNEEGQIEKFKAKRNQDGSFTIFNADGQGNNATVSSIPSRAELFSTKADVFKNLSSSTGPDGSTIPGEQPRFAQDIQPTTAIKINDFAQLGKQIEQLTSSDMKLGTQVNQRDALGMESPETIARREKLSGVLNKQGFSLDSQGNAVVGGNVIAPVTFSPSALSRDIRVGSPASPGGVLAGGSVARPTGDVSASALSSTLAGRNVNLSGPTIPAFGSIKPVNVNVPDIQTNFSFSSPNVPSVSPLSGFNIPSGSSSFANVPGVSGSTQKPQSFLEKAKTGIGNALSKITGFFKKG